MADKPTYKFIKVTTYGYDDKSLKACNAYLESEAERVAQNGVLFFPDKIVVQVVENFQPNSWHDFAIEAVRNRINGLISKRLGRGEDKLNLEGMLAKMSILKPSGGTRAVEALMAQRAEINRELDKVNIDIRQTDEDLVRAKQMLVDIEDGKIKF